MPRSSQDGGPGIHRSVRGRDLSADGRLLAVIGPTGTGKTALAIELAEALDGELIGCDSLQLYREFNLATAKPTKQERARAPYHLVDVADPRRDFTLARFVALAQRTIREIIRRGRQPILVGGTGMYLRGLLRGIVTAPRVDADLRRRLLAVQARRGDAAMHRWLSVVDPASAARLASGDRQRVRRALEWWLSSGTRWSGRLANQGTWSTERERYDCVKIGLDADREWLRRRLESRVNGFFASGLVDEVRSLLAAGVSTDRNAFKAIGYREVAAALLAGEPMDAVIERVQVSTRRLVRRQRTWFRKEPAVHWLDAAAPVETLTETALDAWYTPPRFGGPDGN